MLSTPQLDFYARSKVYRVGDGLLRWSVGTIVRINDNKKLLAKVQNRENR